jgi:CRISPR-associated endonuclease/helicase Cas3
MQALVVAGLVSVADWIGSGSFFEDPTEEWRSKIEESIDRAGFIAPTYEQDLSFEDIFGFSPRPLQNELYEAVQGPGLYILEAPMGMGKTEAALYAAYRLLSQGLATGIYFALPTQLTSDKIHERMDGFLRKILQKDSLHTQALLLHGNAWLRAHELGEEGAPGGAWFRQGKRGILAPFAVGTIDQALMAVMNVKHGFVRTFGLAGKVVILDEVHAYDMFTGTIIDSLIEVLRSLQCTVIVLSATLTNERRKTLAQGEVANTQYPLSK